MPDVHTNSRGDRLGSGALASTETLGESPFRASVSSFVKAHKWCLLLRLVTRLRALPGMCQALSQLWRY